VEGDDIFSQFRGDIKGNNVLPGTIIAVKKQSGQVSRLIPLVKALSGAGISGRNPVSGKEKKLEVLDFEAFANEFKAGVNIDKFGIDAVANKPYALLKVAVPLLGDFMEKFKGTHRREALNQGYSSNLLEAPSSRTQRINSNIFVGGVAIASQPAYVDTISTYAAAINTAIPDTPAAVNQMNLAGIKLLERFAITQKRIKTMANGKYVVTVPTNQKYILMDETVGLGKFFMASGEPSMLLKNWIGEWSRLMFVEDQRSSMLTAADGGSSTLVWTYTTVDDSRPAPAADNWDVAYLLGPNAVIELELEALHLEDDPTVEYGREKRTAAFANYGDQLYEWQDDTDVRINKGSIVCLFASLV
jgi:hypothetical protein